MTAVLIGVGVLGGLGLVLGLLLGWRLWRRLWRPRIIRED